MKDTINILKDDFCVSVKTPLEQKTYTKAAVDLWNKYGNKPLDVFHYNHYTPYKGRKEEYYGYKDGKCFIDKVSWRPLLSVPEYSNKVKIAIRDFNEMVETIEKISVDEFSII